MSTEDKSRVAPVAIVGMSCRLSGNVSTLGDFWTLISRSRNGWSSVPEGRFSSNAFYHPNPQKKGCFNQRGGYYMDYDFSKFDAPFFHITKQEAIAMDPQQRQLLECTYEALENAGIPKESIAGSNMGVFVGGTSSDYRLGTLRDLNHVPMFDATGNHQSIQAGRISYYFDLHGPCLAIDTACSSSLSALHCAVQSIRSGEADSAIVAGCHLLLEPDDSVSMSMLGILNDHGMTFSFDHRADSGFARGEGVGCLILKPLEQAIQDNDHIYSVIVNTGANQDGKTAGISKPSGNAQERLIRDVYARAGISPQDTGFVEAHGTGTKVGDPIEASAISRVFSPGRTKRFPLYMGSVKTNFGHLENASGIISIIKASLMLEKGFILPNTNFERTNDAIPMDKYNLKVPTSIRPWPTNKRFISVNNFGFGGSNSHVVLERLPVSLFELPQGFNHHEFPRLFVLSANDEAAAKHLAAQIGVYIEQHPEIFQKRLIQDIAYTLGERRTHLPWRIAITASSCNELGASLNGLEGRPRRASVLPNIAFVYTGQGAQWPQMGRELMNSHPVFAHTIHAASRYLEELGAEFSLIEELSKSKETSSINRPHISQAVCTAIQLGLTDLLSSWGIQPFTVTGHSSGEISAAYATGAITLQDAMAAAYHRGRVASKIKYKRPELSGGMLAVGTGPLEVKGIIESAGLSGVAVACENSPNSVTVSGDMTSLDELATELETRGLFNRKLRVDVAYHSYHMQLAADEYMEAIKDMSPKVIRGMDFYSSLLGNKLDTTISLGPSYWIENLVKPVRFSSALQHLYTDTKPNIIVEIGPHSALEGPIKQVIGSISKQAASEVKYLPSLIRNKHATTAILQLAGNLFSCGQSLDFGAINQTMASAQKPAVIHDFSPYPWSHQKYWFESRTSRQHRLKPFAYHDLLGTLEDAYSDTEPTWRNCLTPDDVPWLKDHRMQSLSTFPLAGYICMAVEAASQRNQLRGIRPEHIAGFRLHEIQASKALIFDEGAQYEMLFSLKAYSEGTRSNSNDWDEFRISSWTSSRGWLEHCRGLISIKKPRVDNPVSSAKLQNAVARRDKAMNMVDSELSLKKFYRELQSHGADYSPPFVFQPGSNLVVDGGYSTCTVTVPNTSLSMPHYYETPSILPTAFLDLFFQLTFPILGAGRGEMGSLFMPSAIKEADISIELPNQPGNQVRVVAHGYPASPGAVDFTIDAWHAGQLDPVVKLAGFRMTPVNNDVEKNQIPRPLCYSVDWVPWIPVHADEAKPNGASHNNGDSNGHNSFSLSNGKQANGNDGASQPNGIVKDETTNASMPSAINSKAAKTNGVNSHHKTSTVDSGSACILIITDRDGSDSLVCALTNLVGLRTGSKPSILPFAHLKISSSARYIFLAELDAPILYGASAEIFTRVKKLLATCSSILWVTVGAYHLAERPENNISQGFLRTVRSELSNVAASLDLDPNSQLQDSGRAKLIFQALEASCLLPGDESPLDYEFTEENGQLVVPRVIKREDLNLTHFRETQSTPYLQEFQQPGRRLKIAVGTHGALDSLYWEDESEPVLGDDEVEIKVAFTGLNFKDVVIAMGQVASPYVGVECSGTIARAGPKVTSLRVGDRVCAMSLGAYGTYARCPATSATVIPDDMDFGLAASIPVVYSTAYYGIVELARMEAGESILIHAASGGVGQAAIQLAQNIEAEIFATVGSVSKKQLLMDTYSIPEDRIFYSRDTDFGPAIREATGGKGVDVVVNSLAGDLLRESWESLASFGRFIEIGKRDITSNAGLEMAKFEQNCTFSSVDLTLVAAERPKIMGRVLRTIISLLANKSVKPIRPISTVSISEVETALRNLQSGKTSGKVVVSHLVNKQVKATHPVGVRTLQEDATYLVIGGTGGIGRSLVKRMVERGARHIVLLSRSGKITTDLSRLISDCEISGASVYVNRCDVADRASVEALITYLQRNLPPIRGLIHAAMVLRDVLFEQMTFEDYEAVLRSKVFGAENFHNALSNTPLDFFVMLSSVAGIVGNRGQAAYAAANTYLDALARFRRRKGMAATSLNLTAVDDVGYLAENATKQSQVLKALSGSVMSESDVLALVDIAIVGKLDGDQCITGLHFEDSSLPYYFTSDAKFSQLRNAAYANLADDPSVSHTELPIAQKIQRAPTAEEALKLVTVGIQGKLGAILMMSSEDLEVQPATMPITAAGLDSLNAIELRNWISKELQAHLQVLELLASGGVGDLAALVLRKTRLKGDWSEKEYI